MRNSYVSLVELREWTTTTTDSKTSDNQMHKQLEACVVFILRKLPWLCHFREAQTKQKQFHLDKLRIAIHVTVTVQLPSTIVRCKHETHSQTIRWKRKPLSLLDECVCVGQKCNGIQSLFPMTTANIFSCNICICLSTVISNLHFNQTLFLLPPSLFFS